MSRPTFDEHFARVVLIAFAVIATAPPARAAIPEITWESAETVDASVDVVSGSTGVSVLNAGGVWHVVYEKSGEIFVRARSDTGWLEPQQLSMDPGASRSPHVAIGGGFLHVVWEDERSGHPEVWTRRWDGSGWSSEECLSCDPAASLSPVIGGSGDAVFAAWENDAGVSSAVVGRRFAGGSWSPVEPISASPASAREPSVVVHPISETVSVLWSDARHGDAEIYLRRSSAASTWSAEERMTNVAGSCRLPSAHAQDCCPDLAFDVLGFVFEHDLSGTVETYGACWAEGSGLSNPERLSQDDGIPSAAPNLGGFDFIIAGFPFSVLVEQYLATWTDGSPSEGAVTVVGHSEECVTTPADTVAMTNAALSYSAIGSVAGIPNAEVLVAWVEDRDGIQTLVAQRGSLPGYVGVAEGHGASEAPRLTAAPNPARNHVALRIDSLVAARADVRIVDSAGRVVRDLGPWPLAAGVNAISWDTRDESGTRVATGRYFATVRLGDAVLREKIVIAR